MQKMTDSEKTITHFSGAVSVTNNGISIVPSFYWANLRLYSICKCENRFSFEPDKCKPGLLFQQKIPQSITTTIKLISL